MQDHGAGRVMRGGSAGGSLLAGPPPPAGTGAAMTTAALSPLGPPAAARPSPPYDFLFATWDGGGHAGPLLSVAGALRARGHRVRVLADPVLRPEVDAAGVEFVAWSRAPHRRDAAERAEVVFRDWQAR